MTYSPNRKHERGDGRMKIQHIACDGATVCKGIRLRSIAKLVAENFSLASVFQHDIRCSRETSIRKKQTDSSLGATKREAPYWSKHLTVPISFRPSRSTANTRAAAESDRVKTSAQQPLRKYAFTEQRRRARHRARHRGRHRVSIAAVGLVVRTVEIFDKRSSVRVESSE
jgi:hypothetical protein